MGRLILIILAVIGASFLFFTNVKDGFRASASSDTTHTVSRSDSTGEIQRGASNAKSNLPLFINTPQNPHWQSLIHEYESYLATALNRHQAPGVAVAIVRDSSVLYAAGHGFRDYPNQQPVDIHSVFRLGSVSKSLASTLTALLVQDGVLQWDDPVVKYLPNFRLKTQVNTDHLTIANLLSHTTGLPYHAYTDRVDEGANFDTLVYHLRELDLIGEPGKVYSYQNVAFSIISKVIEAATGKSYEQNMQEKLFDPLGMADASLTFAKRANTPNKARPHQHAKKEWRSLPISYTYYNVGPAGGVNASIRDMALWMKSLTNTADTLFTNDTKAALFQPAVKAIARNRNFRKWKKSKGSYYALGWRVLTFKDDTLNYHGGYVNGFRSEVAIKRNDHLGVVVLVNSAGPLADHAVPEFFLLYEKYRTRILQWEKENTAPLLAKRDDEDQ